MLTNNTLESLARYSASRTRLSGVPVYVVGGAVRDSLLGRVPREYDFAFDADEETFLQRNPRARKVGKSVSVILLNGEEYMPLEGGLMEDMFRRDLTTNALAVDWQGHLFAHPAALSDLENHVFRPASPDSFLRDPVRVFRLARLMAEWPDFQLHPEAVGQMHDCAALGLLEHIPVERLRRELMKALSATRPSAWFEALMQGDCLMPWFPELEQAATIPAGPAPFHSGSVLEHLFEVMNKMAGDPLGVWMALCHDLGKIRSDSDKLPHHYGHELAGAELAVQLSDRLEMPTRYRRAGELASLLHMKAGIYPRLRIGTRCDLLTEVHAARLDESFWKLVEADGGRQLMPEAMRELELILSVSLPEQWRNKGAESGIRLRELRCQILTKHKVTL